MAALVTRLQPQHKKRSKTNTQTTNDNLKSGSVVRILWSETCVHSDCSRWPRPGVAITTLGPSFTCWS
eukprot:4200103-Amphidinium_carterae.1